MLQFRFRCVLIDVESGEKCSSRARAWRWRDEKEEKEEEEEEEEGEYDEEKVYSVY